ncbi:hypothetical protein STM14_0026 [Salmonella enterica subsp. enterica serovar Typhimurium str. 14028S]|uniref:Uncharacterized protein n=2 Tax=Salmonella enterica I TaxID=59201 RepID=A0A0F6AWE2_SALT1|nr:hypothetical protein SPAB_00026 [Salmonella enterica subsp. enterica serovar Paratyphi B str. SPB7]ACY86563.1 hypothetical protein STM14_0026 [Salmonella enterica subsp. enterica serovar Typhimurium str. 14028S]
MFYINFTPVVRPISFSHIDFLKIAFITTFSKTFY